MNQKTLIAIIILAGIGSIGSVLAYTGTITANQGSFNNVLVTGTCTGCGASEGSFTTYSLVLNETVAGTNGFEGDLIQVGNDGSSISDDASAESAIVKLDGTVVKVIVPPFAVTKSGLTIQGQSLTGEYKIVQNTTGTGSVDIYKNNAFLQRITFNTSSAWFSKAAQAIGVSPDGKYIGIFGNDKSNTINRLQIWQGS